MGSELAGRVVALFERWDESTAALQTATGLHCPPGCGRCCAAETVEASVLELLPLAEDLYARGEADHWAAAAEAALGRGACVFYSPERVAWGGGRCQVYPLRPLLCRLFGYAAVNDKHGRPELAACRFIKDMVGSAVEDARTLIAEGFAVLCFRDASTELYGLDPHLGSALLPINAALLQALGRVALSAAYTEQEQGLGPDRPGRPLQPGAGGGPRRPRRAA